MNNKAIALKMVLYQYQCVQLCSVIYLTLTSHSLPWIWKIFCQIWGKAPFESLRKQVKVITKVFFFVRKSLVKSERTYLIRPGNILRITEYVGFQSGIAKYYGLYVLGADTFQAPGVLFLIIW